LTSSSRMAIFITQMDDIKHHPSLQGSGEATRLDPFHFWSSINPRDTVPVAKSGSHHLRDYLSCANLFGTQNPSTRLSFRSRTTSSTKSLPPGGTMSNNTKKIRAIAITVIGVLATNIAISFASGASEKPSAQPKKSEVRTSGAPAYPNPPRPHSETRTSGAPAYPNPPRP
jgi:hypothetical protein